MKKNKKQTIFLDNSPEAQEARRLKEALLEEKEYLEGSKYQQKTSKTKEAKETNKLKKAAEKSKDSKEAEVMQKIADEATLPKAEKEESIGKVGQLVRKFWKK